MEPELPGSKELELYHLIDRLLLGNSNIHIHVNPSKKFDIKVDECIIVESPFIRDLSYGHQGPKKYSLISLNRPVIMEHLFVDGGLETELQRFKNAVNLFCSTKDCRFIQTYFSCASSKDRFLSFTTIILVPLFKKIFKEQLIFKNICDEKFCDNFLKIDNQYEDLIQLLSDIEVTTQVEDCSIQIINTQHQTKVPDKCATFVTGSFSLKTEMNCDDVLSHYLDSRYSELFQQTSERLFDESKQSVDVICQKLLPFVVLYDLYSISAPFNPFSLSPQALRDSLFIHYNIARIAHIRKGYSTLNLSTSKIDYNLLNHDMEWNLTCQILSFRRVFDESFIEPIRIAETKSTKIVQFKLYKLFQYLVKIVRTFSKYYSSCKIIVHESKESMVIKMNTRMKLIDMLYHILVFCLRDIFNVPLVLNM